MVFPLLLLLLMNVHFSASSTIMLLTALHYAYAPMLPHYYYAQNYASIIRQDLI